MRVVNGLPLVLAALMLGAGMMPATAQDVDGSPEVTVEDPVSDEGTGSGEAEGCAADGEQATGEDPAPGEDPSSEVEITFEYEGPFVVVDDFGPAEGVGPIEDADPYIILAGEGEANPEDVTTDPEGEVEITLENPDFPVEITAEPMMTATGGGPLPGTEEVQRGTTAHNGSASGGSDESCTTLPQGKRPLTCD